MIPVYILGAGGFGREVHGWASDHPDCGVKWRIAGFLDDNPEALLTYALPVGICGNIAGHVPEPDALYLCALGSPATKRAVCTRLAETGAKFLTLVHPRALVGPRVSLGEGCVICPGVVITCDVRIDRWVTVNLNSTLGHDVTVGEFSTISSLCDITGFVCVGAGVFLGSRSGVVPSLHIGDDAHVGAGSTVIAGVPSGARVFGVPARRL
jgi:sugar O-acyltransferase (sialic acid O-acetyltransferase NeuD family)